MLALVFASSCAQEELAQNASDEAVGTLSVSIPDVMTKAYGDGMYDAKNLIIGVFDENGVEKFRKNLVWGKDVFTQEIKIQFVMGKKYQMVFWAQYGNAYGDPKSMPLDEIKLDYKVSNREDLDAFYAYVPEFTVTQDFSKNITLKRPFAQLNFATEVGDMDESIAAGDLGIHNKAAVTIKNVANTLDLFTGKTFYVDGDGAVKATGVEVVVPETEFPKVDGKYPTIVVEEKTYEVISMNYVLVADDASVDGKTTVDLKLKVGELEIEVPNAYMKRNWRTNVVGELLTGEGTFKVTIDPIFDGAYDHNWNDGTSGEDVVNTFAAAASEKNPAKVDAKGGKYYVDVTSNVAWTVTVPQGLKAEPATGDKDAEVVVTVPENTTEKDVTYEVVVKTTAEVATKEYKFTVAQAAAAPVVPDEPDPIVPAVALTLVSTESVPAEGGNVVVKVTSNVAWTLALDGTKVTEGAEAVTDFEVTVPVAANTATEVANHTLLLSDVPAEGAQAVTATAQFTQAAAQPEEPEVPVVPVLADGTYWIVANGNYATPISGNYGYIKVEDAGYIDNAFKFTAVEGGYTIQDATGKYYYQTGTYNSFNVAAEMPAEGAVWTIAKNDDGSYVITNVSVNKSIQYDTEYNSYGSYAEVKGIYPSLVDAKAATERPAPEVPDQPEVPVDGDFASNVEWTLGEKAYSEKATINGEANVSVLKLGTSSVVGTATFTIPAGTSKISFYGVAWNGKTGKLTVSVPSNDDVNLTLKSNTGAANNTPYTITVTSDDYYEIELATPCTQETTVSLSTVSGATRVILFGIKAE